MDLLAKLSQLQEENQQLRTVIALNRSMVAYSPEAIPLLEKENQLLREMNACQLSQRTQALE